MPCGTAGSWATSVSTGRSRRAADHASSAKNGSIYARIWTPGHTTCPLTAWAARRRLRLGTIGKSSAITFAKIRGIKLVRANGSIYRYHRATGKRIAANPDTHPETFFAEVKLLEAEATAKSTARLDPKPSHLGGLFTLYRASPEFTQLEHVTQAGYQRAMDALKTFDAKVLVNIDQPWILKVRDEVYAARGRWLANQVVAVLSIVLGWGVPRGIVATNAAKGVPKIRRPKKMGVANKAWRPAEVDAFLKATYEVPFGGSGLRKAVALAYYGGLQGGRRARAQDRSRRRLHRHGHDQQEREGAEHLRSQAPDRDPERARPDPDGPRRPARRPQGR